MIVGICYWYIMIVVLLLGYIMIVGTVIGVHYDSGYCYWGTL